LNFNDDTELPIDMLVISAGIRPRDELAKLCGLHVGTRGGILVDAKMQTSDNSIFAIGECALYEGMIYGLVAPGYEMADTVGHRNGWMSKEYLKAVRFTADCMERLYDAMKEEDQFILLSDHGGHEFDHFDETCPEDMTVPLFCAGSLFPKGKVLRNWSLLDIAPTVFKALDVEIPRQFEGISLI
jgi:hypothetical protein